ncbi:hypothetical protein TIFTF001_006647 [Ficus carica]|uniref:Uncharacterized protein n=1 Tax=Ficus carica TaxID=3494 RepID=A0AA87ZJE6_FICCA|nr:hypothetical protein TIFTF001_006647 [Ficus carica]
MDGIVVVFDFDKKVIECDSDNWVVDELAATDLFNQLLPTMPWNFLMRKVNIYLLRVYCSSLKEEDFVMPRKNFPVWDLISKNPQLVKAQIHGKVNTFELLISY